MCAPGVRPTFGGHSHTVAPWLGPCGPQARLGPSWKRQPLLPNKVAVAWGLGLPLPRRRMRGRPPSPAGSLQKKVPLERLLRLQPSSGSLLRSPPGLHTQQPPGSRPPTARVPKGRGLRAA